MEIEEYDQFRNTLVTFECNGTQQYAMVDDTLEVCVLPDKGSLRMCNHDSVMDLEMDGDLTTLLDAEQIKALLENIGRLFK